jgi:hypothetical protein
MQQNTEQVISDHQVDIVIRRKDGGGNETTLDAQSVRVERTRSVSMKRDGANTEESRTRIVVVGSPSLDIQKDDRFNALGGLFRVTFVRPNTQADRQAEAELIK